MADYFNINKESWNKRTNIHIDSEFYNNKNFINGQSSLNPIELELLGNISGKKILHLQCHFGQDTISLSRLGAHVTGIDISDNAIAKAQNLAKQTNSTAKFICCNIYDLPNHLNTEFDIVFTSYGTIIWLPDLSQWANIISKYLKPDGQFVFVEFHPVLWMYDENYKYIKYNYFNTGEIIETEDGSYTDGKNQPPLPSITWNHSLAETITALLHSGLNLKSFQEYDYSPYNFFNDGIETEKNKYRIKHLKNNIPMLFSIVAQKQ